MFNRLELEWTRGLSLAGWHPVPSQLQSVLLAVPQACLLASVGYVLSDL